MTTLYESFGSFNTGHPSYRVLTSKKSRGTISLTENLLSFESQVDKILFQLKMAEIQVFIMKKRFSIPLVELKTKNGAIYSLYPLKINRKSFDTSIIMTEELFRQLARIKFLQNHTILFDTIGSFFKGRLQGSYLKEELSQGHLFITKNYISFIPFDRGKIKLIKIIDIKLVLLEIVDSTTIVTLQTIKEKRYSLLALKKQWRKLGKDKIKTDTLYDVLNQAQMHKNTERIKREELKQEQLRKVRSMLEVSTRLKLKMMRTALDMDKKSFNIAIFEWAKNFNLTIDGDYILIKKESIPDFLEQLNSQLDFSESEVIECSYCGNSIISEFKNCPYCGNAIEF
jgi:hypothetical protein